MQCFCDDFQQWSVKGFDQHFIRHFWIRDKVHLLEQKLETTKTVKTVFGSSALPGCQAAFIEQDTFYTRLSKEMLMGEKQPVVTGKMNVQMGKQPIVISNQDANCVIFFWNACKVKKNCWLVPWWIRPNPLLWQRKEIENCKGNKNGFFNPLRLQGKTKLFWLLPLECSKNSKEP